MEIILIIGLIALMALNAYASHQCFRDNFSSREQRLAQIAFIWIVPFLGAALALRLSRNEPEQSSRTYQDEPSVADEYVTGLGRQNSRGYISSPDDNFHSVGCGDASPD
jgi:hypothetical protein